MNWERLFINLSSTAAFVRRLFALNEGIAATEVSKIHIDPLPPEQKVGRSNPPGRKCSGLDCAPAFPPMTSRRCRCRVTPSANLWPPGGWTATMQVREVSSGAAQRQAREKPQEAARGREIDVVLVWRLDRWGRPAIHLLATLQELEHLRVGFVSLTEMLMATRYGAKAAAPRRPRCHWSMAANLTSRGRK